MNWAESSYLGRVVQGRVVNTIQRRVLWIPLNISLMATCTPSTQDGSKHQRFNDLGLDDWLLDQCKAMGLKKPTPIQQNCILPIIQGVVILISEFILNPSISFYKS